MHCDRLFPPSPYLAASDLAGKDVTMTMDRIEHETVKTDRGSEVCAVLYFREIKEKSDKAGKKERGLILNRVNGGRKGTIAALYGTETNDWIGQRITLYPTTTLMKSQQVECIRIRPTIPPTPRKPAAKPTNQAATQPTGAIQPAATATIQPSAVQLDPAPVLAGAIATAVPISNTPGNGNGSQPTGIIVGDAADHVSYGLEDNADLDSGDAGPDMSGGPADGGDGFGLTDAEPAEDGMGDVGLSGD